VLTDLIPVGQEYVPGSATISGGTESHADGFSFDGTNIPPDTGEPPAHNGYTGELTYTFGTMQGDPASFAAGGTFNEEYTIEFKTDVLDVAFVDDGTGDFYDDDDTFALGNQAGMTLNGTSLVSNAATVDIDVDHINKLGEHFFSAAAEHGDHLAGAKQINWTIEVNNNDLTIINPIVTDTIPAGLTYIADSFRLLDSSGTVVETDAPAGLDVTGQNLTYTFADDGRATINDNSTILFSTSVEA